MTLGNISNSNMEYGWTTTKPKPGQYSKDTSHPSIWSASMKNLKKKLERLGNLRRTPEGREYPLHQATLISATLWSGETQSTQTIGFHYVHEVVESSYKPNLPQPLVIRHTPTRQTSQSRSGQRAASPNQLNNNWNSKSPLNDTLFLSKTRWRLRTDNYYVTQVNLTLTGAQGRLKSSRLPDMEFRV